STDSGCFAIARNVSSAVTLPEPSQMDSNGDSRNSLGIPDSSTYPLPPRHSSASAAWAGERLHTQYFDTDRANLRNAASWWSRATARSVAPANRHAAMVAA